MVIVKLIYKMSITGNRANITKSAYRAGALESLSSWIHARERQPEPRENFFYSFNGFFAHAVQRIEVRLRFPCDVRHGHEVKTFYGLELSPIEAAFMHGAESEVIGDGLHPSRAQDEHPQGARKTAGILEIPNEYLTEFGRIIKIPHSAPAFW